MTTLISVNCGGDCIGRCDARCYEAREEACDCICSGVNHTVGYERAILNTQAIVENMTSEQIQDWLAKSGREEEHDEAEVTVTNEASGLAKLVLPSLDAFSKTRGR